MKHLPIPTPIARRQRGGAVLQITMVLLAIGLVIGAGVARGTFVQTKIASNFYDRQIAFQIAQAALRVGEAAAQNGAGGLGAFRDCTATAAPCLPNPFADDATNPADKFIVAVSASDFDFHLNRGAQPDHPPQYVVEYLGNFPIPSSRFSDKSIVHGYGVRGASPRADFYRVTARSSAPGEDRASVTLQSIFYR